MGVRVEDLPPEVRKQVETQTGTTGRRKPSRAETGERTVGRCVPADGTACDWTGTAGAAWERHVRETGHGRLELVDHGDE